MLIPKWHIEITLPSSQGSGVTVEEGVKRGVERGYDLDAVHDSKERASSGHNGAAAHRGLE